MTGHAARAADSLRVAFWNTELSRKGPGLLLRDLERGEEEDILATLEVIAETNADILVLQGIDWDFEGRALAALATQLAAAATPYPYRLAPRPNRGTQSGFDLNDNGRRGDPQDAVGYGEFTGQNGLALLSRFPIAQDAVEDFTAFLWADLPGALLPYPGMPEELLSTIPLSTTSHSLVPVDNPALGRLWLGLFAATTPVFDGPEDRNGRRGHDEVAFWSHLLNGTLDRPAPQGLIVIGTANLDPERGDGRQEAIRALLAHPSLQDPAPQGDLGLATVDFGEESAGALRVAYILPDLGYAVQGSGMIRSDLHRHRLIWVDLAAR
jgi:hypothetical protein